MHDNTHPGYISNHSVTTKRIPGLADTHLIEAHYSRNHFLLVSNRRHRALRGDRPGDANRAALYSVATQHGTGYWRA